MAASFTSWLRIMNWVEMAQEQVWEKREEEGRTCFFFGEEVKGSIILPYIRVSYRLDCLLSETETTSFACP